MFQLGGGFVPIETERLVIRQLSLMDAHDIFAVSANDNVSRYVLWDTHRSLGDSKAFIRHVIHQYRVGEAASWGIELKESGQVIGTIGFVWISHDNMSAEVGYSLGEPFWNQGYMTEALQAVLTYGFAELRLNRIEGQFDIENPASGKVMEKCGMEKEGVLRQRLYNKGKFVDVAVCSILRRDYLGRG